jgi:crossover junction endodeoxyribonuclease RusA
MTEAAFSSQNIGDVMFAGLHMPPRVVVLGWPSKTLSPNAATIHWATKAKAVKAARTEAYYAACAAFPRGKPKWTGARIHIAFCPPDRRKRDLQNCIASAKALVDGIADALGIDDSTFQLSYALSEPVKGGSVRVEIWGIHEQRGI